MHARFGDDDVHGLVVELRLDRRKATDLVRDSYHSHIRSQARDRAVEVAGPVTESEPRGVEAVRGEKDGVRANLFAVCRKRNTQGSSFHHGARVPSAKDQRRLRSYDDRYGRRCALRDPLLDYRSGVMLLLDRKSVV